jgi:tripartite-type tricarboxylate transporter receptor subunit TctC
MKMEKITGRKSLGLAVAATLALTGMSLSAQAVDIPCGTAKLIVPWGAGGGTDVIFRVVVDAANKAGAKPQMQVVNIGGQGGNKGAKEARKAKPDGCTLFAIHQSAITSYFTGRVDFSVEAFAPVALLSRTPAIFGANPEVPYNNLTELIAAAKAAPKTITAGGTLGSTSQFVFLLLEDAAGIKFKHVSYDGTRERMTALLAKNIHIGEINLTSAKKYIQTNELKALGITTAGRNADIPDVATASEQGVNMVYGTDRGIVMPKDTSPEIVAHYEAILKKAMSNPDVVAALNKKGTSVEFKGSADYEAYFKDTFSKWKAIAIKVGAYKRTD